ncbi:hypothetical protein A1507_09570 [Methylomonas koyamae]|uniref:Peptidase S8/S53 domain-containing protein n=1 Tax=Methylomonas koyamae TaxID=702114 RepID=A0A177NLD3_9GAMM|nr:hypothetical protein [Methylomonas koyamae]OAI18384.1 hypothetical protein A1507_09570 [Methylomonas koyamae]
MRATKRLGLGLASLWCGMAQADYRDDIGYRQLQQLLGSGVPTGAGVNVVLAEASTVTESDTLRYPRYAPDTGQSRFAGKTFSYPGPQASTGISDHATGVAAAFFANDSIAPGIANIAVYNADDWLSGLVAANAEAPVAGSRIANHSWIGRADGETAADIGAYLRLVDRVVQRYEFIQVVGMDNGPSNSPLLGSAYNAIAVGRSDGGHDRGSDPVDSVYGAGRSRPDLVAPRTTTSGATPLVAAAAALLVETGHSGAGRLSKAGQAIAGIGQVYNAERAETVKAALMAGARRVTDNSAGSANIADYRSAGHQTANGLDDRFGAGQLDVFGSYRIIAGGEQDSVEDGGSAVLAEAGFDFDQAFGGLGSNRTASYRISAVSDLQLAASLVWNIGVSDDSSLATVFYDLDLELFDTTLQRTVGLSNSRADNSENLWLALSGGHDYQLRVIAATSADFVWDYALAWRMEPLTAAPVPLPAAALLFSAALLGFAVSGRGGRLGASRV